VKLHNLQETAIPINHQGYLSGIIYSLLKLSDQDYARFLHDEGYSLDGGPKRFKLFVFSHLRAKWRRSLGETLWLRGPVEWFIASPVEPFLVHIASGLLSVAELRVGWATFPIESVETTPAPDLSKGELRCICLSPIVAAVRLEEEGTYYLRPSDGEAFSEAVRNNLLGKHRILHGCLPEDNRFSLEFDPEYLEAHRGGTKLITYKGIQIVGAFAPFTVTGSPALLEVGYDCGFGEKNAAGFGMVEVRSTNERG